MPPPAQSIKVVKKEFPKVPGLCFTARDTSASTTKYATPMTSPHKNFRVCSFFPATNPAKKVAITYMAMIATVTGPSESSILYNKNARTNNKPAVNMYEKRMVFKRKNIGIPPSPIAVLPLICTPFCVISSPFLPIGIS